MKIRKVICCILIAAIFSSITTVPLTKVLAAENETKALAAENEIYVAKNNNGEFVGTQNSKKSL